MSTNKLTDESNDKKYFLQTPQIVLALCRNPYDYTLWNVIKMIAGEYGQCTLSTPDLGKLAMMSTGKAHDSRAYLLEVGLLEGGLYRDPSYPQAVWHLRIPDIWLENITWRQLYDSLGDRLELRAKLKSLFDEAAITRRFKAESFRSMNSLQDVHVKGLINLKPSPPESLPEKELSQNERHLSRNEKGVPQNERKKNQVKPTRRTRKDSPSSIPESTQPPAQKPLTPSQQMFSALVEVFRWDPELMRGRLNKTEKELREAGRSLGDVEAFGEWWYANDWRGKKGQPPTLTQLKESWGQFKDFQKKQRAILPAFALAPDSPEPERIELTPEEQIVEQFKELASQRMRRDSWETFVQTLAYLDRPNGKIRVACSPVAKEWLDKRLSKVLDPIAQELSPGGFEYVVT